MADRLYSVTDVRYGSQVQDPPNIELEAHSSFIVPFTAFQLWS